MLIAKKIAYFAINITNDDPRTGPATTKSRLCCCYVILFFRRFSNAEAILRNTSWLIAKLIILLWKQFQWFLCAQLGSRRNCKQNWAGYWCCKRSHSKIENINSIINHEMSKYTVSKKYRNYTKCSTAKNVFNNGSQKQLILLEAKQTFSGH